MPIMPGKSKKMLDKGADMDSSDQALAIAYNIKRKNKMKNYAQGGEVKSMAMDHDSSIADAIMRRRKEKMMADGGMVDIEENGEESPASLSPYDDDNMDAIKKELYEDDQMSAEPMDSMGHESPGEDDHDMVSAIRRKMKMRKP